MQQQAEKRLSVSQRISQFTGEADKVFNHLLGYALAFSALIAFADVLGDGKIVQYIPWLFWIWVIAQGLGVEFQVFVLIRRLPRLWSMNRAMFYGNIVFILFLCLISIFIGSVFVQHDNVGGTIEQSMSVLGINHILFIYARSALSILLIAIIAIDRALEQEYAQDERKQAELLTVFDGRFTQLAQGFDQRLTAMMQESAEMRKQTAESLAIVVQSEAQAREHMIATMHQELHSVTMTISQVSVTVEAMERQSQKLLAIPKMNVPVVQDTPEKKIRAVLATHPNISIRALAQQAGVSNGTAGRWKKIIDNEQSSKSNGHQSSDVSSLRVEAKG